MVLESRRVLFLSSNSEFYLQHFRLQVVLTWMPTVTPVISRMAAETPEEREGRLQQKSTREREKMAAEAPEERERRYSR